MSVNGATRKETVVAFAVAVAVVAGPVAVAAMAVPVAAAVQAEFDALVAAVQAAADVETAD